MRKVESVCVYCGSSNHAKEIFKKAAQDVGSLIARNKMRLVYGGGYVGLMGIVANAALHEGGYVQGFMTNFLDQYEGGHRSISELHIVGTMHERKQRMFENSDAFIILPGGFGTLDEAFEMMTWKQVGLHTKAIIFLNIENYWGPLFDQFVDHMIESGFVRNTDKALFSIINSVDELMHELEKQSVSKENVASKWF